MIEIEKATSKHLEVLSILFNEYRIFYNKSSDIDRVKVFLNDRLEGNESVIYIAFNEIGIMTGFTQLYPLFSSTRMERIWLLSDLFVHKKYRGLGISIALIDQAKELCKQTAACGLTLETAKTNEIGNKLYPKAGFTLNKEYNFYSWDI